MLESFWFNVNYGIQHVLDSNAYDHVLFLMGLAVPYLFKDKKRVLILVSVFTLGHTLSLMAATYNIISVKAIYVEFLIPITILIVAVYNIFTAGKTNSKSITLVLLTTLFFGIIHGLGFAREFRMFMEGLDTKLSLLLEFALGIEIAQIIVVVLVLIFGFILQFLFRLSKRDYVLVVSSIVIGLTIPMIMNSELLN